MCGVVIALIIQVLKPISVSIACYNVPKHSD